MIHELTIDRTLNRLMSHFGRRLVLRPPATPAELADLAEAVGPLPRGLLMFLATCNGLRIEQDHGDPLRHLWGVREMLAAVGVDSPLSPPPGLVPVCGELRDECDCVVVLPEPVRDVVVRWNASAPGARIVTRTFERYFETWAGFVIETSQVPPRQRGARSFDACVTTPRDFDLERLREDPRVKSWLRSLDVAIACGDDFE
jgi:hypothetical protein